MNPENISMVWVSYKIMLNHISLFDMQSVTSSKHPCFMYRQLRTLNLILSVHVLIMPKCLCRYVNGQGFPTLLLHMYQLPEKNP